MKVKQEADDQLLEFYNWLFGEVHSTIIHSQVIQCQNIYVV